MYYYELFTRPFSFLLTVLILLLIKAYFQAVELCTHVAKKYPDLILMIG